MLSHFSRVWLFANLWTVARQALLSMGFSTQEPWSGLPCPPPGDLPDPGIKSVSLLFPAMAAGSLPVVPLGKNECKLLNSVWLFATRGLYNPWNSPGQNTGVGSHSLLQGIFPTQGMNPGFLHCRQILYSWATREAIEYLRWIRAFDIN